MRKICHKVIHDYLARFITEATLVHFPVGMYTSYLTHHHPAAGAIMAVGFLTYEVIEDWRIKDRGYRDVFGFLLGFGLMSAIAIFYLAR